MLVPEYPRKKIYNIWLRHRGHISSTYHMFPTYDEYGQYLALASGLHMSYSPHVSPRMMSMAHNVDITYEPCIGYKIFFSDLLVNVMDDNGLLVY